MQPTQPPFLKVLGTPSSAVKRPWCEADITKNERIYTPSFECFHALRQLLFIPCNQHKYPAHSNDDTKLLRWVLWILWSCLQILTSGNYMQWGSRLFRKVGLHGFKTQKAIDSLQLLSVTNNSSIISVTFDNLQSKPLRLDYINLLKPTGYGMHQQVE
jgi:hypothetical protein